MVNDLTVSFESLLGFTSPIRPLAKAIKIKNITKKIIILVNIWYTLAHIGKYYRQFYDD